MNLKLEVQYQFMYDFINYSALDTKAPNPMGFSTYVLIVISILGIIMLFGCFTGRLFYKTVDQPETISSY